MFRDHDGTSGAKCWGNKEWWIFFPYFLILVVQTVVNHWFPFPSFSIVLLRLKELLGLVGSVSFVLPLLINNSMPCSMWEPSTGHWKSLLHSWHGTESLCKMALSSTQYTCVGVLSFVYDLCLLASDLCFPHVIKNIFHKTWCLFLNVRRKSVFPLISGSWTAVLVFFYTLRLKKNPGSLSLSRALKPTCADNLAKWGHFQTHSDILKLMNV